MSTLILDQFALVSCTGSGAAQLLQGQTSADIVALKLGDASFFCLCNLQGRMIVDGLVLHGSDQHYHLAVMAPLAEKLMATLARYAPFYKVEIYRSTQQLAISTKHAYVFLRWPMPVGFILLDDRHATTDHAAQTQWLMDMMSQGVVFVDQENTEAYLPSDIGWDTFAVSFTKGCYTGQEIVARVHYRGKHKQHFCVAMLDILAEDAKIKNAKIIDNEEKECGSIVAKIGNNFGTCLAARIDKKRFDQAHIAGVQLTWKLLTNATETAVDDNS